MRSQQRGARWGKVRGAGCAVLGRSPEGLRRWQCGQGPAVLGIRVPGAGCRRWVPGAGCRRWVLAVGVGGGFGARAGLERWVRGALGCCGA